MREILFRGRIEDNGRWVYGYYAYLPDATGGNHLIFESARNPDESNTAHIVDIETVGQYTGSVDVNGKKIFEGDIVRFVKHPSIIVKVVYHYNHFMLFNLKNVECFSIYKDSECLEVIGNIYDNPELMQQGG